MYGGSLNSASVIGKFGNPYQDYIAAFGLPVPNDSLNLIPVTGNTAISAPVPSGYGASIPSSMALTGPAICEICKTRKVEIGNASQVQQKAQAQPCLPGPGHSRNPIPSSTSAKYFYHDETHPEWQSSSRPEISRTSPIDCSRRREFHERVEDCSVRASSWIRNDRRRPNRCPGRIRSKCCQ